MFAFCLTSAMENTRFDKNTEIENCILEIGLGDKSQIENLYKLCKTAIYGYSLSILKNRQDSEDVLQETFIKIYNASSSYKPNGNPMPWVLTITKNLSLMKLRERKRYQDTSDEQWESMCFSQTNVDDDDKIILSDVLSILTDEERQMILLHSTSGLKHREIAKLLGIGLSTALSKYNRAIKKLKKYMDRSECNVEKQTTGNEN